MLFRSKPITTARPNAAGFVITTSLAIPVGKHKITFHAKEDGYMKAGEGSATLVVSKASTDMHQTSMTAHKATSVTLRATLIRKTDKMALPNQTVTFFVGGAKVGTGVTDASGQASLAYTTPKSAGKYALKVTFAGDASYLKSVYSKAMLTVK